MIGSPKELIEALDWGTRKLRRLVLRTTEEARFDAALITSAMTELIRGIEPPAVTGKPGRAKRSWQVIPAGQRRRLLMAYEYKKQVKRAPKSGKRKAWETVPLEEYFTQLGLVWQDEWGDHINPTAPDVLTLQNRWISATHGAELDMEEVQVLFLRIGLGMPVRQVAEALNTHTSQVQKRIGSAMRKAQAWIESRGWDLDTYITEG